MITVFALPLIERAINTCLQTDLQALAQIQTLDGRVIELNVTDWQWHCFILPTHHGVKLKRLCQQPSDTVIRGTLPALFKVGLSSDKSHAIKQNKIEFQGDIHIGMTMQRILSELDIDWESLLAERIGDRPAILISQSLKKMHAHGQAFKDSICQNTQDYLINEARLCPSSDELNAFYRDIATLRDDVERLEARLRFHLSQSTD